MTAFTGTISDILQDRSNSAHGITFLDANGTIDSWTFGDLNTIARKWAGAWRSIGVKPGDRVGLLGSTTPSFVSAIFGAWAAGVAAVPIAVPMRLSDPAALIEEIRSRCSKARVTALGIDDRFALLGDLSACASKTVTFGELEQALEEIDFFDTHPDDPALIQFTSGSTSRPKGVVLTHNCLVRNAWTSGSHVNMTSEDVIVSWLPLFHDFGLIGMTLWPLFFDLDAYLIAPETFISSPKLWMQSVAKFGGTITAAPNFAYGLAARGLRSSEEILDLSRLRIAANGAEPVDATTIADYIESGRRHGLRTNAPLPVYGLAEATLGVAAPAPGHAPPPFWVDADRLASDGVIIEVEQNSPAGRPLMSVGGPIPECEIEIRNQSDEKVPDGHVGEVCLKTTSLMAGYFEDTEATEAVLHGGWLHTGDLGVMGPGGLYITGRIKDMIIVAGRNLYPEDAERATNAVPGVRRGNTVAFGVPGRIREGLVVIAETRLGGEEAAHLAHAIAAEVRRAMQIAADHVVLLRPGSLPKTPSGKLQRRLTRALYEAGQLIGTVVGSAGRGSLPGPA